ncbi:MAG: O-antigen ligase family protein [Acidimicrobiales bacterium]
MRFAVVVAVALLAVDPFGWDRFGPLRWALVPALGFAAIAATLGEASFRERPLPRWLVLGWTLLLSGLALSTLLSDDRWHALIGTPDRHLGLVTWVLFLGLMVAAAQHARSATTRVLRALSIGGIAIGCWALAEVIGLEWFDLGFPDDRAGGPFGQPAYLGAAATLLSPTAVALSLDHTSPRRWRVVALIGSMGALFALGASGSRAAWVGFGLATLVVAVVNKRRVVSRFGPLRAIVLFVTALSVVVAVAVTTPVGERARTLTDPDSSAIAGRVDEWRVGFRSIDDAPFRGVLGHGPEGYRLVFGANVDTQYVLEHGRTTITDRAHSGPIDVLLTGGVIASVGHLLLLVGVGAMAVRRMRRPVCDVGIGAAVLGYLVQQLFLFPLAEVDPILWILVGLMIGRSTSERASARGPVLPVVGRSRQLLMLGAGIAAAVAAVGGASDIAADHRIDTATGVDDGELALESADSARNLRADSIRYDFIAARIAGDSGGLQGARAALDRIRDGLATSPLDPALLHEEAGRLLDVARFTDDPIDVASALSALRDLDERDPLHPEGQQRFGIALALAGRPDEAIPQLETAASLVPFNPEPLINLAIVHLESGDLVAGAATLDRAAAIAPANAIVESLRREFLRE